MAYKQEDFTIVTLCGEGEDAELWIYTPHAYEATAYDDETRIENFLPLVDHNKEIFSMPYPGLIDFVEEGLKAWDYFACDNPLCDNHYFWMGDGWE